MDVIGLLFHVFILEPCVLKDTFHLDIFTRCRKDIVRLLTRLAPGMHCT